MFDYLQQFNNLPKELRDKVSSSAVMATLSELEKKYQVDLAMVVMKVMIKSQALKSLSAYFVSDYNLSPTNSEALVKELTDRVFLNVAVYLGLEKEVKALDLETDINLILADARLVLPSSDLVSRFKSILSTYLKGIRSKVAARDALTKPVAMGGLNLAAEEVDRVFRVCEQKTFKSLEVNLAAVSKIHSVQAPQSRLDKIIASADGTALSSEYNLKQALAAGQVKKPEVKSELKPQIKSPLDTTHELPIPEKELNLPLASAVVLEPPVISVAGLKPIILPVKAPIAPIAPKFFVAPIKQTASKPAVEQARPAIQTIVQPSRSFHAATPVPPIARPVPPVQKPIASARPLFSPTISKQAMHDIKAMPKVMGPLEELQFLDLLNFRRLGKTPAEITSKIFSKVKLLEADGYDKMVSGVYAWRQSPVNRLYLKMVQEAMNKSLTIKDFALAKQKDPAESKNYLSLEEIEAILAMNSKLVF